MRVNDEYPSWNASLQTEDEHSVYTYWSNLLEFRKNYLDIVVYGDFKMLSKEDEAVMAYRRESYTGHGEERKSIVVVLNFQPAESKWNLADGDLAHDGIDNQVLLGVIRES